MSERACSLHILCVSDSRYNIPFNTHVWSLGPLIKQNNLRVQLQFRNFQFLLNAFNSTNDIVKTCIQSAMYNSNTCIGYKLAF